MLKLLVNFFFLYMLVWWTVFLVILPRNTVSYAEAGIEITDGGDPAAPVDPKLKQKLWTTTWVSLIIYAIAFAVFSLHIIHLPDIPTK